MYIVDGIAYAGEREKPLAVVAVKPLDDYKLWTRFSTGASRIFDFAPLLDTGAFKALKDKAVFCGVYVDGGVPCWNNGQIDIAPEYLYENGRTKQEQTNVIVRLCENMMGIPSEKIADDPEKRLKQLEVFAYVILCCIGAMSAIFGYQFSRGKWLRLISGNTFLPDKELKTPEMSAFAKCVGKTMYSAVILVIAIAAEVYISKHFAGYSWIGTLIFIAAMALLFVSLIVAVLNHPQIKSRKRKR